MDKFAFLIHPIYFDDYYRKLPFLKKIPEKFVEEISRRMPPVVISNITGVRSRFNECAGQFIACPLTSKQFIELPLEYSYKKIISAARLAEKNGAKIVGLGAFTSVVGDAGVTIAKNVGIAVTTGNSYTIYAALEGAKQAAELMGIEWGQAEVTVLGATGSIGSVCARWLANEVGKLNLVARDQNKLNDLVDIIKKETKGAKVMIQDTRQAMRKADVVVAVSASLEHQIFPEDLKPGAVVCDVARPRDVSPRVAKERNDVLVIEGGVINVPEGTEFNFDFGFPPGKSYACMAETMILALEKRFESYSLGRDIELEKVREIGELAKKHGFELDGFRSFERNISSEEINRIKENSKKAKRG